MEMAQELKILLASLGALLIYTGGIVAYTEFKMYRIKRLGLLIGMPLAYFVLGIYLIWHALI